MDEGGEVELVEDERELAVCHLPLVFAAGASLESGEVAGPVVESLNAGEIDREVKECTIQQIEILVFASADYRKG